MKTVLYGSKSFVLETPAAIALMERAAEARRADDMAEAGRLLDIAVKAESRRMPFDEAMALADPGAMRRAA